jgi:3-oxoacyl-[acyl-carrier protein] reductase
MPGEFQGKVVVVSGGSRGIGRAIAAAFARDGAQTVLAAANADNLAKAAKSIGDAGGLAPLTVAADLRTLAGCEQVFKTTNEKFGRCDILINNAGATRGGNFFELPDDAFIDGFALKYFAAIRLTRLFWPLLKTAHGNIINIIGGAARTPGPEFLIGGSVNSAFANFSKGLAALGNRDDINVNVIHPGMVETDRVVTLFQQFAKAQNKTPEEVRSDSIKKSGTRRIGQPEDVAEVALFLASPRARHIQGTAIAIDGGATTGLF